MLFKHKTAYCVGLSDWSSYVGSSDLHPELERHQWLQIAMGPDTWGDDYWTMMESYFAAHNRIPERIAIIPRWMSEDPDRLRSAWRQLRLNDQQSSAPRSSEACRGGQQCDRNMKTWRVPQSLKK